MIRATVITDASFSDDANAYLKSKNKGQCYGGWAAWVRVDGVAETIRGYGSIKSSVKLTSTIAEMYAAINGAWLARRAGADHILIQSDCIAVIQAIGGSVLNSGLMTVWKEALVKAELEKVRLIGRHVKGHGPIDSPATYVNDWCDRKARLAMRAARTGTPTLKLMEATAHVQ